MRVGRKENSAEKLTDQEYLSRLSVSLLRALTIRSVTQQEVERVTGVDQTTISRAKNGKLKRITKNVRVLNHYANMRFEKIEVSIEIKRAAKLFMAAGGTEDELLAWIRHGAGFIWRHTRPDFVRKSGIDEKFSVAVLDD